MARPLPSPPDLKITYEYPKLIHNNNHHNHHQHNNNIPLTPPTNTCNQYHNTPKRPRLLHRQETLLLSKDFHAVDIIHDPSYCMFKISLDSKGTTGNIKCILQNQVAHIYIIAALCYLPTRYKNIIEFYHIVSKTNIITLVYSHPYLFRKYQLHTDTKV
jgi:hypothetical protein